MSGSIETSVFRDRGLYDRYESLERFIQFTAGQQGLEGRVQAAFGFVFARFNQALEVLDFLKPMGPGQGRGLGIPTMSVTMKENGVHSNLCHGMPHPHSQTQLSSI